MKREKIKRTNNNILIRQPEKFSAAFCSNYDGRIILKQADETYLKLCCCKEKDIGSDIRDILEYMEYKRIKYYFESYRGHKFNLKYVEKFSNCADLLWGVNISVNYSSMKFEGHIVVPENKHMSVEITHDSEENKNQGIIIISRKKKGYFIEFCSDNVIEKIFGSAVGKYIDEKTENIPETIKLCINERRKIKNYDVFTLPDGKREILSINSKPVCRNDCDAAVVEIGLYDLNRRGKEFETKTDEFFQNNIIGSGIISCNTHNDMYFEDINPYLAGLIKEGKINREDLINAHPFRSAIYEKISNFGKISSYNDNGEKTYYIMGAVPVVEGGVAIRIFVFVILAENRDIIDSSVFDGLTPREINVLRLAAEGLNNRHISEALNITEGTTKRELFHCYKKLGVKNKIEIIRKLYHL